jgi:hypothetical protein
MWPNVIPAPAKHVPIVYTAWNSSNWDGLHQVSRIPPVITGSVTCKAEEEIGELDRPWGRVCSGGSLCDPVPPPSRALFWSRAFPFCSWYLILFLWPCICGLLTGGAPLGTSTPFRPRPPMFAPFFLAATWCRRITDRMMSSVPMMVVSQQRPIIKAAERYSISGHFWDCAKKQPIGKMK